MSHLDGLKCLGERANLVNFDEDTVGCSHLDSFLQELHVGHEKVVTHQLTTITNLGSELHPVVPVVLIEAVRDRINRIFRDKLFEISNLFIGCQLLSVGIFGHAVLQLTIVVEPFAVLLNSKL